MCGRSPKKVCVVDVLVMVMLSLKVLICKPTVKSYYLGGIYSVF